MAWDRTLEEPVVALRVEEPLLVEAGALELVVDVGGEDKVVPAVHNATQVKVCVPHRSGVALVPDDAGPPGPELLLRVVGIEAAGVLVVEAVALRKVAVEPLEALAGVGELRPARHREAGAGAYEHGVALVKPCGDLLSGLRGGLDRFARPLA